MLAKYLVDVSHFLFAQCNLAVFMSYEWNKVSGNNSSNA